MDDNHESMRRKPIGIFDSGVGGLTVVGEMNRLIPGEDIVYFGDTARFPYGTRSPERIVTLALQNSRMLLDFDVKMIVVACNTASSVALDELKDKLPVPVIGVIVPGSFAAAKSTKNGRIGIIGTTATVSSGSYQRELTRLNPDFEVFAVACPLFVSLAEEGWTMGPVARMIAETYLADLRLSGIDTLILGCTHYPLLKQTISETLGDNVIIVDSAEATVKRVFNSLSQNEIMNNNGEHGRYRFLVSDSPEKFREIGEKFLSISIDEVKKVTLED